MAAVHFGRLRGAHFTRVVAIKKIHLQFAHDRDFITMFLDEVRINGRIHSPNVAVPLDVVVRDGGDDVLLVMEYVHGETLSRLLRAAGNVAVPSPHVAAILIGALNGLHAAHEAKDERGGPLQVVHRDVSPQNILVGVDGVPRVLDFGIAKAISRFHSTRGRYSKGKVAYMSPEQVEHLPLDRRTDVFAAGIVYWEALTRKRLFTGDNAVDVKSRILHAPIPAPSMLNPALSPAVDRVVMKALERDPSRRFQTAAEFAMAIEQDVETAPPRRLGRWVAATAAKVLADREAILARIELSAADEVTASPYNLLDAEEYDSVPTQSLRARKAASKPSMRGTAPVVAHRRAGPPKGAPVVFMGRPDSAHADPPQRQAARPPAWLGVVGTTIGALMVLGVIWISSRSDVRRVAPPVAPAPALKPSTGVRRQPIAQPRPAAPPPAPATSPLPARRVEAAAVEHHREKTARRIGHRVSSRAESARGAPVAPVAPQNMTGEAACLPPYTIDAAGIRRVKRECL